MTLSVRSVALGAVVSISMAMTAQAATVYSDRASFDAATGSLALETFDTPIARAPVITFDGGIKASRSGTTNSPNEVNSGSYVGLVTRTGSNQITFDFGQTIDSFGADFSGVASLFADLLGTEESVIIAASSQPAGFFGFISDTPFSQLTFRTRPGSFGSQLFSLDNLSSGTAAVDVAPVPLPASLPLLLAAFGGIGVLQRRKAV